MKNLIPFSVSSSLIGPQALGVRINGELDRFTASDVLEELKSIPEDVHYVLADLTGMTFMDSTGMATLLTIARRLAARSGTMMLVVDDWSVLRALELTGLGHYFELRDDYDLAAREFVELAMH